jgi:hypothetical protein
MLAGRYPDILIKKVKSAAHCAVPTGCGRSCKEVVFVETLWILNSREGSRMLMPCSRSARWNGLAYADKIAASLER